jgi:hypothetical protein
MQLQIAEKKSQQLKEKKRNSKALLPSTTIQRLYTTHSGAQIHHSDNTWVCMHFFHQEGTLSVSAGI